MSAYDDIIDLARSQIDELASQLPAYISDARLKLDALQGQQREPVAVVSRELLSNASAYEQARMLTQALPKDLRKKLGLDSSASAANKFDVVLLIYPSRP
jgi:hypothetical protein